MKILKCLTKGLTFNEYETLSRYKNKIMSRVDFNDNFNLEKETEMGVYRDIQAQRLPPNVKIPSRKKPFSYVKTIYNNTNNLGLTFLSYLSPGSWTSSGGSFKLAEDNGYDITKIILDIEKEKGNAKLLEIGAGYAGFKSKEEKGIKKLANVAQDKLGNSVFAYFTNLTKWHNDLPKGVLEYPGYTARDIKFLKDELGNVDLIYSQCAAYFEPKINEFVKGAELLLNKCGLLIFNVDQYKEKEMLKNVDKLVFENKFFIGGSNGTLYIFKKR